MWITLRVLNNRFVFESEIEVLKTEICMLQEYAEGVDHCRFTAVSVKSGLQFRVEDSSSSIKEKLCLT